MSKKNTSWFEKIKRCLERVPKNQRELIDLLRSLQTDSILSSDALTMIEGVFQVSELTVTQIMIPRTQMVSVNSNQTPEDFIPRIWESGHSRFPVFDEKNEQVIGTLLAKDLLKLLIEPEAIGKFDFHEYLRTAIFVPESKRLDSLLQEFKRNHQHMAIVVDEYGSISGLVTIEDVLEQIVGSIDDEYDLDEDQNYLIEQANGTIVVKAIMPLEEFNHYFKVNYPITEASNTIGGYLLSIWHRVPRRNEQIQCDQLIFTVLHADYRRIHLLSVMPAPAENEEV